jgi:hypothetical protein
MVMPAGLRRFALMAHVTSSVGWMGAVGSFLALAVAGLTSENAQIVRAVYIAMEVTTWFVIVPLSVATLVTGLVQSLGTEWGLFKHYWVVVKLIIGVLATAILLLHTRAIEQVATVAMNSTLTATDVRQLRVQLTADAIGAIVALLIATALSIYKPRGLTPYGRDRLIVERPELGATPRWVYAARIIAVLVVSLFLIAHLMKGRMHGH